MTYKISNNIEMTFSINLKGKNNNEIYYYLKTGLVFNYLMGQTKSIEAYL